MARIGFNVADVDPASGGGPLPPGEYEFQVIAEELVPNNSNTGEVLKLTYEVLGPDQAGRQMWVNMNVSHSNPVAQKIGQEELSALCHAIGKVPIEDTEELLWTPFRAITKIAIDKNNGQERAAVKKYLFGDALDAPAQKAPPQRPAPQRQAQQPAQQQRQAPQQQQRQAPTGQGGGGRSLPWGAGQRPGGQQPQHANRPQQGGQSPSYDPNDDIPF